MLFALALVWGSSFILMKKALIYFGPGQLASLRILMAGVALLPVAINQIRKINLKRHEILAIGLVGLLGNTFPAFLFATAQTEVPSAISGVLNSMVPIFTLIIGVVFFRQHLKMTHGLYIVLGFAGAFILVYGRTSGNLATEFDTRYTLLIIVATLCYATSTNLIHKYLQPIRSLVITSFAFVSMLLPMLVVNYFAGTYSVLANDFYRVYPGLLYIAILALVGTVAAVILFNVLIKETNAVVASTVTYLIPMVALMWGLWDGEQFNYWQLSGFAAIVLAVFMMNRKKISKRELTQKT
jgi:drug/metabolite transporter (DMT)-like permease